MVLFLFCKDAHHSDLVLVLSLVCCISFSDTIFFWWKCFWVFFYKIQKMKNKQNAKKWQRSYWTDYCTKYWFCWSFLELQWQHCQNNMISYFHTYTWKTRFFFQMISWWKCKLAGNCELVFRFSESFRVRCLNILQISRASCLDFFFSD